MKLVMQNYRWLKVIFLCSLLAVGISPVEYIQAAPNGDIRQLLTGDDSIAPLAADKLSAFSVDSLAKWISEFNDFPAPGAGGKSIQLKHNIDDSLIARAFLYIPSRYNPQKTTPLVVYLHGGSGFAKYQTVTDDVVRRTFWFQYCEANTWLLLYPVGRPGCDWKNPIGKENLRWLIREVKRRFNVDDNRVVLSGYSDGGSGTYHTSMSDPKDYAQFFPWAGSMDTEPSNVPVFIDNIRFRPVYAVLAGRDEFWPPADMLPILELAQQRSSQFFYTITDTATHYPGKFLAKEMPKVVKCARENVRDPFQRELSWETSDIRFGGIDWLNITQLDTLSQPASWHQEVNCDYTNNIVVFGYWPNNHWSGEGIKVKDIVRLANGKSVAERIGLKQGDIIVGLDSIRVHSWADWVRARDYKRKDDPFTMEVIREGIPLTLNCDFCDGYRGVALCHELKSGIVRVAMSGNIFNVRTSRVKSFSIYFNPTMIDFNKYVTVIVNGKEVFHGMVQKDSRVLLSNFLHNRDRFALWHSEIKIDIP